MELPLTFKDSSGKVIIELLPAVCREEIGKWHMGPGTERRGEQTRQGKQPQERLMISSQFRREELFYHEEEEKCDMIYVSVT